MAAVDWSKLDVYNDQGIWAVVKGELKIIDMLQQITYIYAEVDFVYVCEAKERPPKLLRLLYGV